MAKSDEEYRDKLLDAFFENPIGVIGQASAAMTQRTLADWDRNRARQYALSNRDVLENQAAIDDIMLRNRLNLNYEGLKYAHKILKGEARDEDAYYRQQHSESEESKPDETTDEATDETTEVKVKTPDELRDAYGVGNIPDEEIDAVVEAESGPDEDESEEADFTL